MSDSPAIVVTNARLWSGGRLLAVDALLMEAGRVTAHGDSATLRARAPHARVLDARGATVTPGLCDAHLHFVPWARARRQCDLEGCASLGDALARVAATLAATPGDAPLVGRGWDERHFERAPERAALDALAPMRPVLLHRHDFHALWVNSAALKAAGVTRATSDPEGGRFERDGSGEPTGIVREHAVRAFVALEAAAAPEIDDGLLDDAACALHAAGITSVHDFQREPADLRRMRALAARRRLRVLQHVGAEGVAALVAAGLGSGVGDAWFRVGALKLFADGTLGSRTAAMLAPYADSGGTGMELLSRAELIDTVAHAHAHGIAVAIHAIGDRAVRNCLDAFSETARRASGQVHWALPPRIEHVQLLAPEDLPRFAALGVAASMQPQHCVTDAEVARQAWGSRCELSYPWAALEAAGTLLAFGSDAPVEPPEPWLGIHAALTRQPAADRRTPAFVPEQRIGLDSALSAYTLHAARLSGSGPEVGHLAPGALADVVIWDRDLHAAATDEILPARPAWTLLAGEIVYERESRKP